jgi:hypothetical protein
MWGEKKAPDGGSPGLHENSFRQWPQAQLLQKVDQTFVQAASVTCVHLPQSQLLVTYVPANIEFSSTALSKAFTDVILYCSPLLAA